MKHCTYIWRDPKTNVLVYVGKGSSTRAWSHLRHNRPKPSRLQSMLKKRKLEGYDPVPELIEAPNDEHAIEMEMLLIAMIGREDLGTGTLFNLTDGGDGAAGVKRSEATKAKHAAKIAARTAEESAAIGQKLSATLTGHKKHEGFAEKQRNKVVSDETREKMRAAKEGKPKSAQHKANMAAAQKARYEREKGLKQ